MKLKLLMLMACGVAMSLTNKSSAQWRVISPSNEALNTMSDTVIVKLKENNVLMLTGKTLKFYRAWAETADKVKTTFLVDFNKALSTQQISINAQSVYYFIDGENRRRLKTESPEYSENSVDVAFEIARMRLNLPKYQYTIIDITSGVTMQIFINNPDSLMPQLSEVSIQTAINKAFENKKLTREFYKVEISTDSNAYRVANVKQVRLASFEVTPFYGATLFGNSFSPILGAQFDLSFSNKYGNQFLRTGFDLTGFSLLETNKGELTKINLLNAYDFKLMYNLKPNVKSNGYWVGLGVGMITSNDLSSYDKAFKFGLIAEGIGPFRISIDFIQPRGYKDSFTGLSVKLPF